MPLISRRRQLYAAYSQATARDSDLITAAKKCAAKGT
jgi:hypothetical protein